MNSISSMSGMMQSPRSQMDSRIAAAASAGKISKTDQDALGSALDAIDSSISAERSSGTKSSGDMKSRIDGLIQEQVDAGTLTADQAEELQGFFAQGPKRGGPGGPGGPGGAGGPPPPPPSDETSDETQDSLTSSIASLASGGTEQLDALVSFLTQLRDKVASGSTYDANAEKTGTSTSGSSGLVLDITA